MAGYSRCPHCSAEIDGDEPLALPFHFAYNAECHRAELAHWGFDGG